MRNRFDVLVCLLGLFFGVGKLAAQSSEPPPGLHPALESSEIISELYREYVTYSGKTSALTLKPDSDARFECDIFHIGVTLPVDSLLEFTTAAQSGGSTITLRATDAAQDKATRYVLLNQPDGLRGQATSLSKSLSVTPEQLHLGNLGWNRDTAASQHKFVVFYADPLASVTLQAVETLAIVQNSENPKELFLELGMRSTLEAIDRTGNPMLNGTFSTITKMLTSGQVVTTHDMGSLANIKGRLLPQFEGNDDLPPSYAFRKWAENGVAKNGDLYRIKALGRCHELAIPAVPSGGLK